MVSKKSIYDFTSNDLAHSQFIRKYALRDANGNLLETTFEESLKRILYAIMEAENKTGSEYEAIAKRFERLLLNGYFIPGGRILYALGNNYAKGTLSNCYYIPISDDSIKGIYECKKHMAYTYSAGGGCGIDISTLRPKGAKVSNSAKFSTGSVSFMEEFNVTTKVIGQSGRRGALLISMLCNHPDIEDFITSKVDRESIQFANISVKILDEFMRAVEEDTFFELSFRTNHETISKKIKAKELWSKICENAKLHAEPGLIFWDRVKRESTSEFCYDLQLMGMNPCAEATLGNWGSCNLGSLFLNRFVNKPFTPEANFDFSEFKNSIKTAVRFLDNIVTLNENKHPITDQTRIDIMGRRIGLGVSGFGDMLAMLGIKYDSEQALEFTDKIFSTLRDTSYNASIDLAIERGPFPAFSEEYLYYGSEFIKRLPDSIKARIKEHGIRNVSILSIAPTGTISIMGQSSSGIEPIFSLYTKRNTVDNDTNTIKEFEQYHPMIQKYFSEEEYNGAIKMRQLKRKYNIREAHDIDWQFRIQIQAIMQKYVDASISSTINLPEDTSTETIQQIYMMAWKYGLKGITVYVDNSRNNVISIKDPKATKKKVAEKEFAKGLIALVKEYSSQIIEIEKEEVEKKEEEVVKDDKKYQICPSCGSRTLVNNSGCLNCINPECTYTACFV